LRRLVGFGALDLGAKGHFCAIGGHSAALWFHGSDTPAGAFDAATDWSHFDFDRPSTALQRSGLD
jgi:hypothetical protein